MNVDQWIDERTIFLCVAGSHAYGLNTPESDLDYRGVCVPPWPYITGLRTFEQKDKGWPEENGQKVDKVVFGIQKFMKLAADANPNVLELLFMPEDCFRHTTPEWRYIEDSRDIFLSKKVKHTYTGYAFSQLKRIETHRRWLLNPPTHEPTREEFGLPPKRMSNELFGVMEHLFAGANRADDTTEEMIEGMKVDRAVVFDIFEKERRWKQARKEWEQYQTWLRERNPVRAELEKKYGHDVKHSSHLIRLMLQGYEVLTRGTLPVRLEGAARELVMGIKQGALSYEQIVEMAKEYQQKFDSAYEGSCLPAAPNMEGLDHLLHEVIAPTLSR